MIKQLVKGGLRSIAALVAPIRWNCQREPRLLVLMYHRVLPVGHIDRASEEPGMYVSPETLRMHMDVVRRRFSLVHLDDWVAAAQRGATLPRLACAITFDDGWRDNFEHAFPVLQASATPATIFLVSDFIGTNSGVWPTRLGRLLGNLSQSRAVQVRESLRQLFGEDERLPADLVQPWSKAQAGVAIEICKRRYQDAEIDQRLDDLEPLLAADAYRQGGDFMTWPQVEQMAASGLIRFGSHTRHHTRLLASVSAERMEEEIVGSRSVIEAATGKVPSLFCYPNGDHSPAALAMVSRNYSAAVTTHRGWVRRGDDLFRLNRIGVHEDIAATETQFLARLSGWL